MSNREHKGIVKINMGLEHTKAGGIHSASEDLNKSTDYNTSSVSMGFFELMLQNILHK